MKARKFIVLLVLSGLASYFVSDLVSERNKYRTRSYILEAMFMYGCMKGGDAEESCTSQLRNVYTTMWP